MKKSGRTFAKALMAVLFVAVSILISSMSGSQSRDVSAERLGMEMIDGVQAETVAVETEAETETETETESEQETESEFAAAADMLDVEEDEEDGEIEFGRVEEVSDWHEYANALSDETVGEIIFTNDIERPSSLSNTATLPVIKRSLRINGNGHTLKITTGTTLERIGYSIVLGEVADESSRAVLEVVDLAYIKTTGRHNGLITEDATKNVDSSGWTVKLHNVSTGSPVRYMTGLVTDAPNTKVELSGNIAIEKRYALDSALEAGDIVFKAGVSADISDNGADDNQTTELIIAKNNIVFENNGQFVGTTSSSKDFINAGGSIEIGNNTIFEASSDGTGIILNVKNVILNDSASFTGTKTSGRGEVAVIGGDLRIGNNSEFEASKTGTRDDAVVINGDIVTGEGSYIGVTSITSNATYGGDALIVKGSIEVGRKATFEVKETGTGDAVTATGSISFGDEAAVIITETGSGSALISKGDIVFGKNSSFNASEAGAGDVINAAGNVTIKKNSEFTVSEADAGAVISAKNIIVGEEACLKEISAKGAGSLFVATEMEVLSGAKIETSYTSPNSNPSAYLVNNLTIGENAEIKSTTNGSMYGFSGKNFIIEAGASVDFEATGSANAVMYIGANGRVIAEPNSNLKIRNREGTSKDETTSAAGIYGKAAEFTVSNANVDILVNGWAFMSDASCTVNFRDGAKVKLRSDNGMALGLYESTSAAGGTYKNDNHVIISGSETNVQLEAGDSGNSAGHAAMYVRGTDATVEVLEGAYFSVRADSSVVIDDDDDDGGDEEIQEDDDDEEEDGNNVKTDKNSALQIQGDGAIFKVHGKSVVKLSAAKSNNQYSPVLRFRYTGNMTLDIDDAELYVQSDGGKASTIRLYGKNNTINVKNGGYLYVRNPGNGTANNGASTAGNMAIHYKLGSNGTNTFNLEGEKSTVEIISNSGPAIYANGTNETYIHAGEGTIFEAYGKTKGHNTKKEYGIFNSAKALHIELDKPAYFDFKNGNMDQPAINASVASSTFSASDTSLSMWRLNSDWNLNPSLSIGRLTSLKMSGANYKNIVEAEEWVKKELTQEGYTSIMNYNRVSSNNVSAIIDELRIPTNADQVIYGHMSIPEGRNDAKRDAWDNEGYVLIEVLENGESQYGVLKATTERLDAFELGNERSGMFKIVLPEDKYLKEGQMVRVVGAWRGEDADDLETAKSNPLNVISAENDLADDVTVQPVVPPKSLNAEDIAANVVAASRESEELALIAGSNRIAGSSEEIGAAVYVYINDELVNDGSDLVGENEKWEVKLGNRRLAEGDKVFIALNDKNMAEELEPEDLAYLEMHTLHDGGNQNPVANVEFHNKTFKKGLELYVEEAGEIIMVVPDYLDFGSHSVGIFDKLHKVQNIKAGEFGVGNTRRSDITWSMYLTVNKEFTNIQDPNVSMKNALIYKRNGEELILDEGVAVNILNAEQSWDDEFYDIYDREWYNGLSGDGLYLKTKAGVGIEGDYEGQLTWTLLDVPGNE